MEVSTKLFNAQATKNFSKINEQIQDTQAKIASGKSFLKASDDPVTASNLSAKREQKILLERFIKNGNTAKTRLDLADSGLNQVINVLTRFSELSIQAANDTNGVDDRLAMVKEMEELATLVLEITNTQDANGKSIFAGFKAATSAFNKRLDGTVEYVGDRGKHALQVSENMKVVSGLDGGTVFGSIKTDFGRKSIFEILENSINAAKTASQVSSKGTAPAKAELELAVSRNPQNWSFDLEGSEGKININMNLSQASISDLKDQINLHTDKTGIVATYDETTKKITLSEKFAGSIVISNLEIEGVNNATREPEFYFTMESIDGEGNKGSAGGHQSGLVAPHPHASSLRLVHHVGPVRTEKHVGRRPPHCIPLDHHIHSRADQEAPIRHGSIAAPGDEAVHVRYRPRHEHERVTAGLECVAVAAVGSD